MFDWLFNNKWERWHEGTCDYCGEENWIRLIGDLAHMGIGSNRCKKCELVSDIEVNNILKNIPKGPTKEQLKYRRERDKIINEYKNDKTKNIR